MSFLLERSEGGFDDNAFASDRSGKAVRETPQRLSRIAARAKHDLTGSSMGKLGKSLVLGWMRSLVGEGRSP